MATEPKPAYHHGDLRTALLAAAETELEASGVEGFSLRKVARTAGVSHAAPAHHFGSAAGLLVALAAKAFEDFTATLQEFEAKRAPDPADQFRGAVQGYIAFAERHTALFRLIFTSTRIHEASPELETASEAAYAHLLGLVAACRGSTDLQDPAAIADVTVMWSLPHGLADLLASNRLKGLCELSPAQRAALIDSIVTRVLPRA